MSQPLNSILECTPHFYLCYFLPRSIRGCVPLVTRVPSSTLSRSNQEFSASTVRIRFVVVSFKGRDTTTASDFVSRHPRGRGLIPSGWTFWRNKVWRKYVLIQITRSSFSTFWSTRTPQSYNKARIRNHYIQWCPFNKECFGGYQVHVVTFPTVWSSHLTIQKLFLVDVPAKTKLVSIYVQNRRMVWFVICVKLCL